MIIATKSTGKSKWQIWRLKLWTWSDLQNIVLIWFSKKNNRYSVDHQWGSRKVIIHWMKIIIIRGLFYSMTVHTANWKIFWFWNVYQTCEIVLMVHHASIKVIISIFAILLSIKISSYPLASFKRSVVRDNTLIINNNTPHT